MPTSNQIKKGQRSLLKHANELAELHKTKLDYSEKSLKQVDKILEGVHDEYTRSAQTPEDQDGFYGVALSIGAYLIEVIERAHGPGTWQKDDPKFGPDSWPYTHGGQIIFPVDWALKMIMSGKDESVAAKYKRLFTDPNIQSSKWGFRGF